MTAFFPRAISLFKLNPGTGTTMTVPASDAEVQLVMVNNPSLIALLTINLPNGTFDGQILRFTYRSAITVLNWTGALVGGGLAAALANGYAAFVWDLDNLTWRRCA